MTRLEIASHELNLAVLKSLMGDEPGYVIRLSDDTTLKALYHLRFARRKLLQCSCYKQLWTSAPLPVAAMGMQPCAIIA